MSTYVIILACDMVYSVFAGKGGDLFAIFHPTLWILIHAVYKHLVIEIYSSNLVTYSTTRHGR